MRKNLICHLPKNQSLIMASIRKPSFQQKFQATQRLVIPCSPTFGLNICIGK